MVTSDSESIRDDGTETSFVQAPNITLNAAKAIGSDSLSSEITFTQANPPTAFFFTNLSEALDIDLGSGTLTITQSGAGGNIQLREINGQLTTSTIRLPSTGAVGDDRQIALIAAGGEILDSEQGNAPTGTGALVWDGIFLGTSPITTNNLAAAQDNLFFATGGATSGTYIPEPAANELLISTAITVGTNNTLTAVASSSPASVTGTGNLTINGGVTAGQGILLAQTRNRPGDKITINNSITSNSNTITISAEKDVDTTLVGVLTTTGKAITVTGDRDATGAGRVDLRGNVTSNGGNITITGTGVAQLSGIINSGNATVTIDGNSTASAGSRGIINLVGTIQTTSTSPSALVIRDAASVNLAGTITLSDSVSGTLKIGGTDADAITNDVTQNSGIITVAANTIITAGTSVDLNQAGNDFNTFTATGTTSVRVKDVNSIALNLITAVTTVTVTSGGSVTDNNGASVNIIGASLTITALTGIDTDSTITTLTSASVTGTGNINIDDTTGGLVVTKCSDQQRRHHAERDRR